MYAALAGAQGSAFSVRVEKFLRMLKKDGRLRLLPSIVREVARLERGTCASIASVGSVSRQSIADVRDALGVDYIEQKTAPGLLGGAVITWNDWRIDGSARGRLQKMRNSA